MNTLGLLCSVDLFPVPTAAHDPSSAHGRGHLSSHVSPQPLEGRAPLYRHPDLASIQLPPLMLPRPAVSPTTQPLPTPSQSVITHFGRQPVTDDMNCTTALSGATFIQLACIEYHGRKVLVFPFAVSRAFSRPQLRTSADGGFF